MGGGRRAPQLNPSAWQEHDLVSARLFHACDSLTYGNPAAAAPGLQQQYEAVDYVLQTIPSTLPLIVSRTALHEESILSLRAAARRYCAVEASTWQLLTGAVTLAQALLEATKRAGDGESDDGEEEVTMEAAWRGEEEGEKEDDEDEEAEEDEECASGDDREPGEESDRVGRECEEGVAARSDLASDGAMEVTAGRLARDVSGGEYGECEDEEEAEASEGMSGSSCVGGEDATRMAAALLANHQAARSAVRLCLGKLTDAATQAEAVAAAHRSVGKDVEAVMLRAAAALEDPTRADVGVKAAPVIAGTAASSLGLLLCRPGTPVSLLGAAALFGAGALGAAEMNQSILFPQIRDAFARLNEECQHVRSLIVSKALALDAISDRMHAAASLLSVALSIPPDGSATSRQEACDTVEGLADALQGLVMQCEACRSRTSAFLALSREKTAGSRRGGSRSSRHGPSSKKGRPEGRGKDKSLKRT